MGNTIIALLIAYLLGSLPMGVWWASLLKRVDVRLYGSGRTGTANVWRSAGASAAVLTALTDGLKGASAIWAAQAMHVSRWGVALAGLMAIVGHIYSVFLKFHGGAGTMTSVGVAAALWGVSLPVLLGTGIAAALLVGHTSVASILIAILLPVIFFARGENETAWLFGLPTMLLTLWSLRPNIQRLIKREERFLPMFREKPPLLRISRHPAQRRNQRHETKTGG